MDNLTDRILSTGKEDFFGLIELRDYSILLLDLTGHVLTWNGYPQIEIRAGNARYKNYCPYRFRDEGR